MLVGGWKYVEVCWKYVAGMSIGGLREYITNRSGI